MGALKRKEILTIPSEIFSGLLVGTFGQGLQGPVGKEFCFLWDQPAS